MHQEIYEQQLSTELEIVLKDTRLLTMLSEPDTCLLIPNRSILARFLRTNVDDLRNKFPSTLKIVTDQQISTPKSSPGFKNAERTFKGVKHLIILDVENMISAKGTLRLNRLKQFITNRQQNPKAEKITYVSSQKDEGIKFYRALHLLNPKHLPKIEDKGYVVRSYSDLAHKPAFLKSNPMKVLADYGIVSYEELGEPFTANYAVITSMKNSGLYVSSPKKGVDVLARNKVLVYVMSNIGSIENIMNGGSYNLPRDIPDRTLRGNTKVSGSVDEASFNQEGTTTGMYQGTDGALKQRAVTHIEVGESGSHTTTPEDVDKVVTGFQEKELGESRMVRQGNVESEDLLEGDGITHDPVESSTDGNKITSVLKDFAIGLGIILLVCIFASIVVGIIDWKYVL